MPDQPDDPIHYDMKIPPEPQNATLNQQDEHKGSDEVTHESNRAENSRENNPAPPPNPSK